MIAWYDNPRVRLSAETGQAPRLACLVCEETSTMRGPIDVLGMVLRMEAFATLHAMCKEAVNAPQQEGREDQGGDDGKVREEARREGVLRQREQRHHQGRD